MSKNKPNKKILKITDAKDVVPAPDTDHRFKALDEFNEILAKIDTIPGTHYEATITNNFRRPGHLPSSDRDISEIQVSLRKSSGINAIIVRREIPSDFNSDTLGVELDTVLLDVLKAGLEYAQKSLEESGEIEYGL